MTLELSVLYTLDDNGWWVAEIPEIPGAFSHGPTKEEAKLMAFDAAKLLLEIRRDLILKGESRQPDELIALAG